MDDRMRFMTVITMLLMVTVGFVPLLQVASEIGPRGVVNNTDSEPNDDAANATIVDTNGQIGGNLTGSDHWDNYKFQLAEGDMITINVVFDSNLPLVSVYVRSVNGFLLDFLRDHKNSDMHAVGTSSAPAWYFLNITDDLMQGETYNATFTFSSVSFTNDNNNIPSEAIDVGSFPYNINTSADGDLDPTDSQDFYKVSLKRTLTKADLLVAHMTQSPTSQFWIEVYDSGFNNVDSFERQDDPKPGSNVTYSFGATAAGFYYLRVWAANGTGWYELTLDLIEITLMDDNDRIENATPIVLLNNHTAQMTGDVGEDLDLRDYYSLEVLEGQVINATITSSNYNASTMLPKMHIGFYDSDGSTPYDTDPNQTDDQMDPVGFTNASASEVGPIMNYIKVFVDNVASGGGAYTIDLFTDRLPITNGSLVHNITINESTVDKQTVDTSIQLAKLFTDPDPVDALTYGYSIWSDKGMDDPLNFTIEIGDDADRTVTLTPRASQVGGVGYKGDGLLTLTATDPYGLNASSTFYIRVSGTNHAPFLKSPFNATGEFDTSVVLTYNISEFDDSLNLLDVFDDTDNDQLNFEANGTSPDIEEKNYGYSSVQNRYYLKSITLNETFTVAFDLKNNLIDHKGTITIRLTDSDKVNDAKEQRKALEEDIWFRAMDNGIPQKSSNQSIKLTIQATSPNGTPPKWSQGFIDLRFSEDTSKIIDLDTVSSDIDPMDKDKRTYTITHTTENISVEKLSRSSYRFFAKPNWSGRVKDVILNCTDSFGLSREHTIDIDVIPVPDAPVKKGATPDEGLSLSIEEGTSQSFNIQVTDVDSDIATDLEFNWSLDAQYLRTVVGPAFTFFASYDDAGTHTISVLVSERAHPELNLTANWTITVTNVNRDPTSVILIEPSEGDIYKVGKIVSLRAAKATDPDKEDTLVYTWMSDGDILANGQTYETKDLKKGDHSITLEVTDGKTTLSRTVNITIKEDRKGPVGLDMNMIVGILLVLVIVVVVMALVLRGKKERLIKEEVEDIYAADRPTTEVDGKKEGDDGEDRSEEE